ATHQLLASRHDRGRQHVCDGLRLLLEPGEIEPGTRPLARRFAVLPRTPRLALDEPRRKLPAGTPIARDQSGADLPEVPQPRSPGPVARIRPLIEQLLAPVEPILFDERHEPSPRPGAPQTLRA